MIYEFRPELHPRNRLGRFIEVLNNLKPGDSVRVTPTLGDSKTLRTRDRVSIEKRRNGSYRLRKRGGSRAVDTKSADYAARAGLTGLKEMSPEAKDKMRDRVRDSLLTTIEVPRKGPATPGYERMVRVRPAMSPGTESGVNMNTPWGQTEFAVEQITPDVIFATTPGHGGFGVKVGSETHKRLSPEAIDFSERWSHGKPQMSGYQWFEEDIGGAVLEKDFPGLLTAPPMSRAARNAAKRERIAVASPQSPGTDEAPILHRQTKLAELVDQLIAGYGGQGEGRMQPGSSAAADLLGQIEDQAASLSDRPGGAFASLSPMQRKALGDVATDNNFHDLAGRADIDQLFRVGSGDLTKTGMDNLAVGKEVNVSGLRYKKVADDLYVWVDESGKPMGMDDDKPLSGEELRRWQPPDLPPQSPGTPSEKEKEAKRAAWRKAKDRLRYEEGVLRAMRSGLQYKQDGTEEVTRDTDGSILLADPYYRNTEEELAAMVTEQQQVVKDARLDLRNKRIERDAAMGVTPPQSPGTGEVRSGAAMTGDDLRAEPTGAQIEVAGKVWTKVPSGAAYKGVPLDDGWESEGVQLTTSELLDKYGVKMNQMEVSLKDGTTTNTPYQMLLTDTDLKKNGWYPDGRPPQSPGTDDDLDAINAEAKERYDAEMAAEREARAEMVDRFSDEGPDLPEPPESPGAMEDVADAILDGTPMPKPAGGGDIKDKPLYDLADEIRRDWKNVNFGAKPYLDALGSLSSVDDDYGLDPGRSIVAYFLSNARGWKGEKAKEIKAELKRRLSESAEEPSTGWRAILESRGVSDPDGAFG